MLQVNWPTRSLDWKVGLGCDVISYGRMANRNCEDQKINIEFFLCYFGVWSRNLGSHNYFLPVSYVALLWM